MDPTAPTELRSDSWIDPRCEVFAVGAKGQGVRASAPIAAGEVVQRLGGTVVNEADLLEILAATSVYCDTIQIAEDRHLLIAMPQDEHGRSYSFNHACDSNLWMTDALTLAARCAIAAGEEITVDYALFTTLPGEILDMACRCGAASCRGRVLGDDWQRADVQARYQDHFSPFINARIAQHAL